MDSRWLALVELLLFFGLVFAWGLWQWWDWRRWRKRREAEERDEKP